MDPKLRASIISHTHWDREWYMPFQGFRMRMVAMIDELIEKMEADSRYRFFHFDGQAILFRDYLEIRPQMEERLRALCRAGRIIAGPMYVAPDESLPGAETHVRNFLLGLRVAGEWGPVLDSGYMIDVFGHISQWPQILRGFGIDNAIVMRGVNDDTCGAEFIWKAPDGSEVLAIRLSNDISYSDFWYRVRQPDEGGLLAMPQAVERLADLIRWQAQRHSTGELLLMDGVDHIEIQPDLPDLIESFNAQHGELAQVAHEALPDYLQRLRASVDRETLVTLQGELRSPNKHSRLGQVFFGYHCSHPELKAQNDRCEALLQYWVEPLMAADFLQSGEYDPAYLWYAWEQLLQNQPHDSICGCSIDQVHRDMMYRYDQCRLVAEALIDRHCTRLAARQAAECEVEGAQAVHVFNGAGAPVAGTGLLTIPIPHPRPEHFDLLDHSGRAVPVQIVGEQRAIPEAEIRWGCIPRFPAKDRLTVAAQLNVPAMGSATYHLVPAHRPRRTTCTLHAEPGVLANGLIEVTVDTDGTLVLWDKRADRVYEGLMRFEDSGDVGDGWTYRAPRLDERVLSSGATVGVICDGPLYAALRVESTLSVPRAAAPDGASRSSERVDMRIVSTVAILEGDAALHIETVVDNPARDHKLRVLFPTQLETDTWLTDTQFDLTRRPIAVQETADWDEPAQEIWWQQSLATVSDGEAGLAIIAPECKEAACIDDAARTLALSLFRAFGKTVGTAGEDGPQMLGRNVFRYQIVPYQGTVARAGLLRRAAGMRAGLRAIVLPPHGGEAPAKTGLVDLSPAWLTLTACKKREDGDEIVVRFFNPDTAPTEAKLQFPADITGVWRSNLKEDLGDPLPTENGRRAVVPVEGKQIVTVAVRFA